MKEETNGILELLTSPHLGISETGPRGPGLCTWSSKGRAARVECSPHADESWVPDASQA